MRESQDFVDLVQTARRRCLWYFVADDLPAERDLQLDTLELIKRYGNRDDFVKARRLEQWLRQHSSAAFSVS
ncbi:MAG TPA: hypothetical protein VFS60_12715 [Thermoanaerobaculia bacterium]|nr:hypothetical protein [Thermoanaerobaculia bacterium]